MSVGSTQKSPDPEGSSSVADDLPVRAAGDSAPLPPEAAPPGTSRVASLMAGSAGRNLGLVIALLLVCLVGVITAGERFASVDNAMTILRLASVIGVVSIGMTFVIGGGGIDLSVGAIVALSSVWATTLATQTIAADTHWIVMVFTALAVGAGCGVVNGVLIAYGRIAPFIATLAMLAAARGLAEIIAQRRTQIVTERRPHRLLRGRRARGPDARHHLRARRDRRLGPAQPHDLRPPHPGGRRQPRGGAPRRHQGPAPDDVPLHPGRPGLRPGGRDAHGAHHHRHLHARPALRARRHRRGGHRRHAAQRRSRRPSSAPCSAC